MCRRKKGSIDEVMCHGMNVAANWLAVVVVVAMIVFPSTVCGEDTNITGSTSSSSDDDSEIDLRITTLNATMFKAMIDDTTMTWFDVIVDVRTSEEYITGHLNGSTLVESLALYNTSSEITTPDALRGCTYCNIVVYCQSGSRAAVALQHLLVAGYKGYLYNGLGVSQWTNAGYPLIMDDESVIPPCTINTTVSEQCELTYLSYTSGGMAAPTMTGTSPQPPVPAATVPTMTMIDSPTAVTNNNGPTSDSRRCSTGSSNLLLLFSFWI